VNQYKGLHYPWQGSGGKNVGTTSNGRDMHKAAASHYQPRHISRRTFKARRREIWQDRRGRKLCMANQTRNGYLSACAQYAYLFASLWVLLIAICAFEETWKRNLCFLSLLCQRVCPPFREEQCFATDYGIPLRVKPVGVSIPKRDPFAFDIGSPSSCHDR
jgi:hypothetical protein